MHEEPLAGGNVSAGVVRAGDTVRRPAGPWTPAVHALLEHLHACGYPAAPRPLGIDEQGREILTFARGTTLWPERFAVLAPDARLARVARLIRDFHDAAAGFTPPPDAVWRTLVPQPAEPLAPGDAPVVAHHDLAPWNLVVPDGDPDGGPWVFIDWDGAGPGTRLWDLAYAAQGFTRLTPNPAFTLPDERAAARLRVFADAYGLDETARRSLVPLLGRRTRTVYTFLRDQAALGTEPWTTHWRDGHGDAWRADAEYVEAREALWLGALLA